jgi:photosystem II stability/assembly factor-like uncharacterized protein
MKAVLATRKGIIILKSTTAGWEIERTHFDGVKCSYVAVDKKNKTIWAGINHGHWGPKLHVSKNHGKSFEEIGIPQFPKGGKDKLADFWAWARDSKGRIYLGTDPAALFHSDDEGQTWVLNKSFYNMEGKERWFGGGADGTNLHSILINPKDENNIVVGISVGGVIETKDRGQTWKYSNKGLRADFMPNTEDPIVQDPHLIEMSPSNPQVLWQQNHCGIFKSDDFGKNWQDLSKNKGIQSPFGWGIVVDEKDAKIAYTIPALSDETRVPVKKKLIVQKTADGGKTWKSLTKGLPQKYCYDIIYRHAFAKDHKNLIFGSTTGHVYFSKNSGAAWKQLKYQLPPVYALKFY